MFQFSNKKNILTHSLAILYFLSFLNLFFNLDYYNNFFVLLPDEFGQKSYFFFLNYYFGLTFVPCIVMSCIAFYLERHSYFLLYFIHALSLEFLFGAFGYGGGLSFCFYNIFGFWLSLIVSGCLGVFSWCILLFLILELKKSVESNAVQKVKKKNGLKFEVDVVTNLPNKNLLSVGKKIDIKIDCEEQKALLIKTLSEFGVTAKVVDVFIGPVVTLYSIELAPGIKAVRVINLVDDIARFMEAFSVRISAIPGKNLLGVEISNLKRQMVYFKEGIESSKYTDFEGNLPLYLGCNIYGEHEVFDLSAMPHLLVAGTTGSGKSVGIHTMLLSLLFQKTAKEFKLILIDPKKLELTPYEDIPHLLLPVVTEPKDAIKAVKWAVHEMETRYKIMAESGVRNITSYNSKVEEKNIFPFIVIVIDEMADLMLVVGKEFELYVQRLAQMGRAAGVHMIIATQRPSVDVITGTIKANFPTRISFKLSTKLDSRTILGDMSGAEQLLGSGDMLYLGNNGRVTRIHGSYVSEEDVLLVVDFLKTQGAPEYIELLPEGDDGDSECFTGGSFEDDPLYQEAVAMIKKEKKVSTSFLQRCFPIGYNRAAKLIERMEKEGVISKGDKFGRNREIY